MLLLPGRASLLAAILMLAIAPAGLALGQDDSSSTSSESSEVAKTDSDEGHDEAGHGENEDGEHDHADDDSGHADGEHAEAHGGGHGDPAGTPPLLQIDIGSAICNLAIFLGVFAILAKFVWPTILGGLQAREQKIHDDLESAEQANEAAKALLSDYQTKLDEASTQVQSMLADARKDAEASGQRIVDAAKEEADRQRDRAVSEIETAKKVALSDLAGQTSDMAINVAKQVVGRELKADDHADLIRQALERLPSNN
ncbi:MAG: F0F1 ATP synthase subunit B [Rubripirellula sp.]